MEQLSEGKRQKIKKASTARLQTILSRFGLEDECITHLTRVQLMEEVVKEWLARQGTEEGVIVEEVVSEEEDVQPREVEERVDVIKMLEMRRAERMEKERKDEERRKQEKAEQELMWQRLLRMSEDRANSEKEERLRVEIETRESTNTDR